MTIKRKLLLMAGASALLVFVAGLLITLVIYPGLGLEQGQKHEFQRAVDEAAHLWADTAGAQFEGITYIQYSDDYPMPRVLALCRFKKLDENRLVFFDLRYSGHWWRYSVTDFTKFQNFSEPAITLGNFHLALDLIAGHLRNLQFNLRFVVMYLARSHLLFRGDGNQ